MQGDPDVIYSYKILAAKFLKKKIVIVFLLKSYTTDEETGL